MVPSLVAAADDLGDHPDFAHAMKVETKEVDGTEVVFQNGEVRPDFEARESSKWRQRLSLDGEWEFRFEGEEASRKVTVPHCWEEMPGARYWDIDDDSTANPARYNGAGWYRRTFECEKREGKRYRLEFLGVRERARVFVNDTQVAMFEGLGTPFSIDVTKALVNGTNELKVKVIRLADHQKTEGGNWEEIFRVHTPHPKAADYWSYAGITSPVALWEEHVLTVRKVQCELSRGHLRVRVIVGNGNGDKDFAVKVRGDVFAVQPETKAVSLAKGESRVVSYFEAVNPEAEPWSPDKPALHEIEAVLLEKGKEVDGLKVRFGLREVTTGNGEILVNGNPVFLKGVAMYSETENGAVLTEADHRNLFHLADEADANFVRLQVRERDPMVYQLADELGFMVTGEWGGFWYREDSMGAQTEDRQSVYQSMARIAVWDLMNHPSVVLWCLHNESHQFCPEYEGFVKRGRELVRRIDNGMLPITWAAWHPHKGDPCFHYSDVIGFNEYRGAMDPFEELRPDMEKVIADNPGKPVVILENGGWAEKGRRGAPDERGTEDWQAALLEKQWTVLKDFTPPLCGYTYWILKDYRTRKTYAANRGADGWSGMGLYSVKGDPKLARDVFKQVVPE